MNWKMWLLDTAERTAKTFVQGFLAVVTVDAFTALNSDWKQQLMVGFLAGGYAVLSSFAATQVGAPSSASLLPASLDPPPPEEANG